MLNVVIPSVILLSVVAPIQAFNDEESSGIKEASRSHKTFLK